MRSTETDKPKSHLPRSGHVRTPTSLIAGIGHPLYFGRPEAQAIQSVGDRLIKAIEAGDFPFDGTHTGFRPDPASPVPRLSDRLT